VAKNRDAGVVVLEVARWKHAAPDGIRNLVDAELHTADALSPDHQAARRSMTSDRPSLARPGSMRPCVSVRKAILDLGEVAIATFEELALTFSPHDQSEWRGLVAEALIALVRGPPP